MRVNRCIRRMYVHPFTRQCITVHTTGFLVGFFICNVMMNVVSAAAAAVLVCFLEDAGALAITHPGMRHVCVCGCVLSTRRAVCDSSRGPLIDPPYLIINLSLHHGRLPLLLAGGVGAALPGHQLVITSRVDPDPFAHVGRSNDRLGCRMTVVGLCVEGFLYKTKCVLTGGLAAVFSFCCCFFVLMFYQSTFPQHIVPPDL